MGNKLTHFLLSNCWGSKDGKEKEKQKPLTSFSPSLNKKVNPGLFLVLFSVSFFPFELSLINLFSVIPLYDMKEPPTNNLPSG